MLPTWDTIVRAWTRLIAILGSAAALTASVALVVLILVVVVWRRPR